MKARLLRFLEIAVDLLAYELAELIGQDYKRWRRARRHVRRQAGYKAGVTRRINRSQNLTHVQSLADFKADKGTPPHEFPAFDGDDDQRDCA